MQITKKQLQKIIAEEVRSHVKSKLLEETKQVKKNKTVKLNSKNLRKIVMEELAAHKKSKSLQESRARKNAVKATPRMLRKIIKEEYDRVNK